MYPPSMTQNGHRDVIGRLLTGEIDRPSTGRVDPVRGCLITQAVWDNPP
jgi:hypothetical protein